MTHYNACTGNSTHRITREHIRSAADISYHVECEAWIAGGKKGKWGQSINIVDILKSVGCYRSCLYQLVYLKRGGRKQLGRYDPSYTAQGFFRNCPHPLTYLVTVCV